jgi:hypothetical protein
VSGSEQETEVLVDLEITVAGDEEGTTYRLEVPACDGATLTTWVPHGLGEAQGQILNGIIEELPSILASAARSIPEDGQ